MSGASATRPVALGPAIAASPSAIVSVVQDAPRLPASPLVPVSNPPLSMRSTMTKGSAASSRPHTFDAAGVSASVWPANVSPSAVRLKATSRSVAVWAAKRTATVAASPATTAMSIDLALPPASVAVTR